MSIKLKTGIIASLIALFSVVSVLQPLTSVYATSNSDQTVAVQTTNFATTHDTNQSTTTNQTDPATDAETVGQNTTCERSIFGIGWLVCQITRVIFSIFEWLINDVISQGLLRVDLIENEAGLREAWSGFKTISNYLFIIAFILIIYAEASGRFGFLETYSASRLLPKLAFAAIMTQISFFFVGYLIQIFNSFGDGIGALILAPVEGFSTFDIGGIFTNLVSGDTFFGIPKVGGYALDNIFAGLALYGAAAGVYAFFPVLLTSAALAIAFLVVVLIIRKVIIIALVVTAPLAFAASILPGTEKIFKLWWDNLLRVLAMYPLIIGFIASGQLLARLVLSSNNITIIDSFIAMIAAFAPLFIVPYTFKFAGGAIGGVAGFLQKRVENQKDPRNPNSLMSSAKSLSGQRYDRLMTGEAKWGAGRFRSSKPIMYSPLRRAYNRLPWTDIGANTSTSLVEARKTVDQIASTTGDDVFRAMAVTGGGVRSGPKVTVGDGSGGTTTINSGLAKLGSNFVYDTNGNITTDTVTGKAYKADRYGQIARDASGAPMYMDTSDFYDKDTMSSVRKLAGNKGMMQASAEYAITKAESVADQTAVLKGLNMSKWTQSEKSGMRNGIWYSAKKEALHVKFMKANFKDSPYDQGKPVDINYNPQNKGQKLIDFDYAGMAEFIDTHSTQYELMQQKGPFWHAATEGVQQIDPSQLTDDQKRHIENMAWKAQGMINGIRTYQQMSPQQQAAVQQQIQAQQGQAGGANVAAMGSSAVGEAARNAEEFLRAFANRVNQGDFQKIRKPQDFVSDIFRT